MLHYSLDLRKKAKNVTDLVAVYCIILWHIVFLSVTRKHRYIEIQKGQDVKRQRKQQGEVQYITFIRPEKFFKDGEQGIRIQSIQVCKAQDPRWMTEQVKPVNICTQSWGNGTWFLRCPALVRSLVPDSVLNKSWISHQASSYKEGRFCSEIFPVQCWNLRRK